MSKFKIGICGHFGGGKEFYDGQTVKTKTITEELGRNLGTENIKTVDTYAWKKRPISFFWECFLLSKDCENIIILPAHNGVKVLVPLFNMMNKIFKKKLYYAVIGGWLPNMTKNNTFIRKNLKGFNKIYVETSIMIEELKKQGIVNVDYLPNFKRLKTINEQQLCYEYRKPYKVCTFSRVIKEKGIEDAIKVINDINLSARETIYTLDIYGPIEDSYTEDFNKLRLEFPEYIQYKGIIDFDDSVNTLKEYFILLFPTLFRTEGIPGTIIDAYSAGTPVLASRWNSYLDIVEEGASGYTFELGNIDDMKKQLENIYNNPNKITNIKINCLQKASKYTPEAVLRILVDEMRGI